MDINGVYLIKIPYNGIFMLKIGCSKHILKRLEEHKLSNVLIEPIGYIEDSDYKWLEKDIKYKSRSFKFKGEFFYYNQRIVDYFQNHENFKSFIS